MGKLRFKGQDKPKKRRNDSGEEKDGQGQPKKRKEIGTSGQESKPVLRLDGWGTAVTKKDFKGPCMIVANKSDPVVVAAGLDEKLYVSGELDIVPEDGVPPAGAKDEHTDGSKQAPIHCTEPTTVKQVFTFVPISDKQKSLLDHSASDKFALRTRDGRYLSSTGLLARAVGPQEVFSIHEATDEPQQDRDGPWWTVECGGRQLALQESGSGSPLDPVFIESESDRASGTIDRFVIRVHMSNTVAGSEMLLSNSEQTKEDDISSVVRSLYKETQGALVIDKDLIARLKKAQKIGNLNEQIIEEKAKYLTRW
ncbi:Piso0_002156 [Millerozyma farinosa CBS 7064]|uniref:Piso0_002156 protein n=1 Tax=Pichia sorbitophila (strain ATCC MYA-4447 / BCRC 22081 / CBS 7064 / NBRC 10061 / NRRL Y-12695) TaxID=559304 RepID=G8YE99_PICSO|nr:Piso0_002156 [Millerozyma farinosa CBS 7064]